MNSKLFFYCTLLSSIFLISCDIDSILGNEILETRVFNIADYSELEIATPADSIIYEQKATPAYLRIEVDSNLFEYIKVESIDKKLSIKTHNGVNISPSMYKIYTNSTSLCKIEIRGSADINIPGELKSENLDIQLSGSGSVNTNNIQLKNLYLSISGSGSALLKGNTEKCKIKISGSGDIDAQGMITRNLESKISGSGNIVANVTDSLDAKISGSGELYYTGSPIVISSSISGSGTVEPLNKN